MTTRRSTAGRREEPRSLSPTGFAVIVAVLAAAAGGWHLWNRENRVATTLELQQRLLADGLSGRRQRLAIDRIIRSIDTMSPAEVEQVRASVRTTHRQLHEASIDAYFAAPAAEKQAVLDAVLDREAVLRELRFAIGNNSYGGPRGRPPQPPADRRAGPSAAAASREAKELARLRKELSARYFAALSERAKQRGVQLTSRR